MTGKWIFCTAALGLALVSWAPGFARAETPWGKLMATTQVEANSAKTYTLKEENGPWMIMTCSFSGENAEKQANELALELRKRYKLEAYVHKMDFKLDDPNASRASNASAPQRWQYRRFKDQPGLYKDGAIKEIGVLVGNYPAVDDPDAQKVLQKLKYLTPECLDVQNGKSTSRTLAALRTIQQSLPENLIPKNVERKARGPMGHAFITTNPLLPADYYAPKGGIDEFVLRMNKGVRHSLLDCRGRYTVQVAHFTGVQTSRHGAARSDRGHNDS